MRKSLIFLACLIPGTAFAQFPDSYFENMSQDEKADMPRIGNEYKDDPLDLKFLPPDPNMRPEPAAPTDTVVDSLLSSLGQLFGSDGSSGDGADGDEDYYEPAKPVANVLTFNIQGIKLHMNAADVKAALLAQGYKLKYEEEHYPNMFRLYATEICKDEGPALKKEIDACVKGKAASDPKNSKYVRRAFYEKRTPGKKESMTVAFTSAVNNNQAYRVDYVDYGDASLQSDRTAMYLKKQRREDFWQALTGAYGDPDQTDGMVLWGSGGIMMKAELTGSSLDARISMADGTLMENEVTMQTQPYDPKPGQLTFSMAHIETQ